MARRYPPEPHEPVRPLGPTQGSAASRPPGVRPVPARRPGGLSALNNIGWSLARLGRHAQALSYSMQALDLYEELGDGRGEAHVWDSIGLAQSHVGAHDLAAESLRRAIELCRSFGDRYQQATHLDSLGDARCAAGDTAGAREAWQHAAAILDEFGQTDAAQVRAKLVRLVESGVRCEGGTPRRTRYDVLGCDAAAAVQALNRARARDRYRARAPSAAAGGIASADRHPFTRECRSVHPHHGHARHR